MKLFKPLIFGSSTKKRAIIGLIILLLAITYRYTATLVDQQSLFYAGLGGQGDYDQFIRAATCALDLCRLLIHQNLLIESSILGTFYEIFGFAGGLKAYLYLMLILSSIVATLPYLLFSRKSWITIGGITGSLFLATSDYLTNMALGLPPDNGSLFTFSMFFIVYLLTLHIGTIRWLLFFGLTGLFDGMFKTLFLLNDLAALVLFVPIFLYEKAKKINKFPYSVTPLLIFLLIYSAWEFFVYVKFSAPYFLRGLILSRGSGFISYTSFNDSSLGGNLLSQFFYLSVSAIVMVKRLIEYGGLNMFFLAPIFLGMLVVTFVKKKFSSMKFILITTFTALVVTLLILIKENYFKIHELFAGEYILYNWVTQTYVGIYLFLGIILLFILNFKYSALKLSLPILPYVVMLIILTKNSPFPRLWIHVITWSVILLAYLIDFQRMKVIFKPLLLILFIYVYIYPKMITMITQLNLGLARNQNQVRYLEWVEEELPKNAVILVGGESDLITVGENINRPIIYNSLWTAAVLIKPKEIPRKLTDFSIILELKNKKNFKINKYIILEDDVYLWRGRLKGVADNVFAKTPDNLDADNYSIKVYKHNKTLKKGIYELNLREKETFTVD